MVARTIEIAILCCITTLVFYYAYSKGAFEPVDYVLFYALVLLWINHLWDKLKYLIIIGSAVYAVTCCNTDNIVPVFLGLVFLGYFSFYQLNPVVLLLGLVSAVNCRLYMFCGTFLAVTALCVILWFLYLEACNHRQR